MVLRRVVAYLCLLSLVVTAACENPTEPDDPTDFVEVASSPELLSAGGPTGKMYKIAGTDDKPDQFFEYDWKTSFTLTAKVTSDINDTGYDLPVTVTSVNVKVQQASGGIVIAPSGDVEHAEFTMNSNGNLISAVDGTVSMVFDVWYDLPNVPKEALITVTITFKDKDGLTFAEVKEVRVQP